MTFERVLIVLGTSSLLACGSVTEYGTSGTGSTGGASSPASVSTPASSSSTSPSEPTAPGPGSGGTGGVAPPAGIPSVPQPAPGTQLSGGAGRVLGTFPYTTGIFVVLTSGVTLRDHSGAELSAWPAQRPLTAAAFDGQYLVVADGAFLTTLRPDLSVVSTATLVEPCADGVLLSGGLFVCGPANDVDRIFYTYDVALGTLVASSLPYTYNGIPMRKVPGYDGFVTVSIDISPSDYHLYKKGKKGEAVFLNESPYHGDFRVDLGFAFVGSPATHLVTPEGLFLKLTGTACDQIPMPYPSECLAKEGALGTLTGAQHIVAADSDASYIYALVSFGSTRFDEGECDKGCAVQRIDPVSRTVLTQQIYSVPSAQILAAVNDPAADALIVSSAVNLGGAGRDAVLRHRVDLLPYK